MFALGCKLLLLILIDWLIIFNITIYSARPYSTLILSLGIEAYIFINFFLFVIILILMILYTG